MRERSFSRALGPSTLDQLRKLSSRFVLRVGTRPMYEAVIRLPSKDVPDLCTA
jgi:hypothetical protein